MITLLVGLICRLFVLWGCLRVYCVVCIIALIDWFCLLGLIHCGLLVLCVVVCLVAVSLVLL